MAFGIVNLFTSSFLTGIWFMFIGLFLFEAAETSYQQVAIQKALHGISVKNIMTRNVVTVDAKATLDYLIEEYFLKFRFTSFPVISSEMLVGLLTLHNVRDVPKDKWPQTTAEEAMVKLNDSILISPETEITYALSKMAGSGIGRLIVVEDHKLIGILSQRDIMRLFEVREDLES
jgi:predicted transcriptional regulator